jgi:predicted TIM-barrel fold metal-dependent hydrolase
MRFIDADAHVDETLQTWDYVSPELRQHTPKLLEPPNGEGVLNRDKRPHKLWLVGGQLRLKRHRDDVQTGTTEALRELLDVPARLRHVAELGFDAQVIYPTMFIHAVTDQPDVELAVHGAYNHWLADKTAGSGGVLRWAYLPPVLSMDHAVADMAWAKEHGACAVMKKGVEYSRSAADPYFFPLYAEAERLDLPICFHSGDGDVVTNAVDHASMQFYNVLAAFYALAEARIPDRFPKLRFGFVEAGASWIPLALKQLGMRGRSARYPLQDFKREFLAYHRFYVTCDTEDDITELIEKYGAEDSLMIGTDYAHGDLSGELQAHRVLVERAARGELPMRAVEKIVSANARRCYGL